MSVLQVLVFAITARVPSMAIVIYVLYTIVIGDILVSEAILSSNQVLNDY